MKQKNWKIRNKNDILCTHYRKEKANLFTFFKNNFLENFPPSVLNCNNPKINLFNRRCKKTHNVYIYKSNCSRAIYSLLPRPETGKVSVFFIEKVDFVKISNPLIRYCSNKPKIFYFKSLYSINY